MRDRPGWSGRARRRSRRPGGRAGRAGRPWPAPPPARPGCRESRRATSSRPWSSALRRSLLPVSPVAPSGLRSGRRAIGSSGRSMIARMLSRPRQSLLRECCDGSIGRLEPALPSNAARSLLEALRHRRAGTVRAKAATPRGRDRFAPGRAAAPWLFSSQASRRDAIGIALGLQHPAARMALTRTSLTTRAVPMRPIKLATSGDRRANGRRRRCRRGRSSSISVARASA